MGSQTSHRRCTDVVQGSISASSGLNFSPILLYYSSRKECWRASVGFPCHSRYSCKASAWAGYQSCLPFRRVMEGGWRYGVGRLCDRCEHMRALTSYPRTNIRLAVSSAASHYSLDLRLFCILARSITLFPCSSALGPSLCALRMMFQSLSCIFAPDFLLDGRVIATAPTSHCCPLQSYWCSMKVS